MDKSVEIGDSQLFQKNMMTSFIQIAAIVVLVSFCVMTVGPFSGLVIWGVILAVALYPLHLKLTAVLGGKQKMSVTTIIVAGLVLVVWPGWIMIESTITSIMTLASDLKAGTIVVPPPADKVAEWPLIGDRLYNVWAAAASNFAGTLAEFEPQLRQVSEWLVRKIGAIAVSVIQMAASIIIAGVVMLYADSGYKLSSAFAKRLSPIRGQHLTDISIATIRSVTNGVLGVAVIQAALAGIGFFVMQIPHAGILTAIVLITSIIQVPALLIIAPVVVWVFSFAAPLPATLFAVYALCVALSDNILKPILLGRGVDLPALLVLVGALGGMIQFGIIGLFFGAIILGLGYTIISDWVQLADGDVAAADNADEG